MVSHFFDSQSPTIFGVQSGVCYAVRENYERLFAGLVGGRKEPSPKDSSIRGLEFVIVSR
jgi:hypothetical protein